MYTLNEFQDMRSRQCEHVAGTVTRAAVEVKAALLAAVESVAGSLAAAEALCVSELSETAGY